MEIKVSQKKIINPATKNYLIIRYLECDYSNLFNFPFKHFIKHTIASIISNTNNLQCDFCKCSYKLTFSFLTRKKLKYFKIERWEKFCYKCKLVSLAILKLAKLTDEEIELLNFFIEAERSYFEKRGLAE